MPDDYADYTRNDGAFCPFLYGVCLNCLSILLPLSLFYFFVQFACIN